MSYHKPKDTGISVEYLNECFICRRNGTLVWRRRPREHFVDDSYWQRWLKKYAGKRAGTVRKDGYIKLTVNFQQVLGHHVVWAMATGAWSSNEIDHRDGDHANNRLSNLREAPNHSSQLQNMKRRTTNTSGYTGVSRHYDKVRWCAYITVDYQRMYLGLFDTPEDAYAAYLAAKKKYHPFQPVPRNGQTTRSRRR